MNYLEIKAYLTYVISTRWNTTKRFVKKLPQTVKYFFVHTLFRTETYKWDKRLAKILVDVPKKRHSLYTVVLENQRNYLEEESRHSSGRSLDIDLINIAKLTLDELTVTEIINVQPMTIPLGMVYGLEYTGEEGNRSLEIVSNAVEARTRKLQTMMTVEAVDDFKSMHGLDLANEMTQAVAHEIAKEIINEHIAALSHLAKESVQRHKPETAEDLIMSIQSACGDISADSKRGMGNFAVMSQSTWNIIADYGRDPQSSLSVEFTNGEVKMGPMLYVGTLLGTTKVYVTINDDESILVGYKGPTSELDAGYTWCPYRLILSSGLVVDPKTFQPMLTMMTRSGVYTADNVSSYYRTINL